MLIPMAFATGVARHMESEFGLTQDSFHNIIHFRTGFLKAIQASSPTLLEEINGIADGAGVDRELILAMNLGEELYSYQQRPIEHCSNLAVAGENNNWLTYNQDLPLFLHGDNQPIILQHSKALIFAMPGTIGISGVSKTAAISCNSLPMLKMDEQGLPLSFALRQLLALKSMVSIREYLLNTPLAIPQNLLLASAKGIVGFEISKGESIEFLPDTSRYLAHTNFPIRSRNFKSAATGQSTCNRYAAISRLSQELAVKDRKMAGALLSGFSEVPLSNRESYLRFTATFSSSLKTPTVQFVNPQRSGVIHSLNF